MCGILCNIVRIVNASNVDAVSAKKQTFLLNHDKCKQSILNRGPDYCHTIHGRTAFTEFQLSASVLWLQGPEIVPQPRETEKSYFLFNGDIFGGNAISDDERHLTGDTIALHKALDESSDVLETLSRIQGPFSFIYMKKSESVIYFGRDFYGRKSLLVSFQSDQLMIASVASRSLELEMMELPAIGIFSMDLNAEDFSLCLSAWNQVNQNFAEKLAEVEGKFSVHVQVLKSPSSAEPTESLQAPADPSVDRFFASLRKDSALAVLEDASRSEKWMENVGRLHQLLGESVRRRITAQPNLCRNCVREKSTPCRHSSIGILFSGGIDCSLLAVLADEFAIQGTPIDLLNVAFEHRNGYETPDRLTARETVAFLRTFRPKRDWNLVEIDVSREELDKERSEVISDLIYPLKTILDESLGCALWFASRGRSGHYVSPCRVLLSGAGADELFGGYSRHRAAFRGNNWRSLEEVLCKDWNNISHRNLARDDRVISDHGRQIRMPYLDELVVDFARKLPAWERCFPDKLPEEVGGKLLLRSLAHSIGLVSVATLKKRALQFGSRIALSSENANDDSPRL